MFDADQITKDTISAVIDHMTWKFHHQLMFAPQGIVEWLRGQPHPVKESPIKEQIETLCKVANGDIDRDTADKMFIGEVMEMTQSVVETLYSTPLEVAYMIPETFWATDLGQVVMQAQLWARGDKLITLSEAAEILRGDTQKRDLIWINDQLKRGNLTRYVDPDENNPTKAGRVSLAQVEALRDA